jgi:hypothetical protein
VADLPGNGTDLTYALLAAACTNEATVQRAYLALITPAAVTHERTARGAPVKIVTRYVTVVGAVV